MLRLGRKARPKARPIKVGDRVRHSADNSPRARACGTATVVSVVDLMDVLGTVEYRVRLDLPPVEGVSRETQWPGYVTVRVARGE